AGIGLSGAQRTRRPGRSQAVAPAVSPLAFCRLRGCHCGARRLLPRLCANRRSGHTVSSDVFRVLTTHPRALWPLGHPVASRRISLRDELPLSDLESAAPPTSKQNQPPPPPRRPFRPVPQHPFRLQHRPVLGIPAGLPPLPPHACTAVFRHRVVSLRTARAHR